MQETQSIYRTRDKYAAIRVARELARLTNRCFCIGNYDARTMEIVPQRQEVPAKLINRYKALAQAIILTDNAEGRNN